MLLIIVMHRSRKDVYVEEAIDISIRMIPREALSLFSLKVIVETRPFAIGKIQNVFGCIFKKSVFMTISFFLLFWTYIYVLIFYITFA